MASALAATKVPEGMTKGDLADQMREMRAADREQSAAARREYEREQSAAHEARRHVAYERKVRGALTSSAGGTAAGIMLGGFFYFLGLAYIRGGTAGAKSWLAAKFVNKPAGAQSSVPVATSLKASQPPAAPLASTALIVPSSQGQPNLLLA